MRLREARAAHNELDRILVSLEIELRPAFADDVRHCRRNIDEEMTAIAGAVRGQRDYDRETSIEGPQISVRGDTSE